GGARLAKGATGGEVDEDRARRGYLLQDVAHRADDERRDAARFDAVGEETDGLVAVRSVGHEQRQVGALAGQLRGQRGPQLLLDAPVVARRADEREALRRHCADHTAPLQRRERRPREDYLDVAAAVRSPGAA